MWSDLTMFNYFWWYSRVRKNNVLFFDGAVWTLSVLWLKRGTRLAWSSKSAGRSICKDWKYTCYLYKDSFLYWTVVVERPCLDEKGWLSGWPLCCNIHAPLLKRLPSLAWWFGLLVSWPTEQGVVVLDYLIFKRFVCMGVLPVCVCTTCIWYPQMSEDSVGFPGTGVMNCCK